MTRLTLGFWATIQFTTWLFDYNTNLNWIYIWSAINRRYRVKGGKGSGQKLTWFAWFIPTSHIIQFVWAVRWFSCFRYREREQYQSSKFCLWVLVPFKKYVPVVQSKLKNSLWNSAPVAQWSQIFFMRSTCVSNFCKIEPTVQALLRIRPIDERKIFDLNPGTHYVRS